MFIWLSWKNIAVAVGVMLALTLSGGVRANSHHAERVQFTVVVYICETTDRLIPCGRARDQTLGGYKIDFTVHDGSTDRGEVVQTITVTMGENPIDEGGPARWDQGRDVGEPLPFGTYTVCEHPVAYRRGVSDVDLDVFPLPQGGDASEVQDHYGPNCIYVEPAAIPVIGAGSLPLNVHFQSARAMPDTSTEADPSIAFPTVLAAIVAIAVGVIVSARMRTRVRASKDSPSPGAR